MERKVRSYILYRDGSRAGGHTVVIGQWIMGNQMEQLVDLCTTILELLFFFVFFITCTSNFLIYLFIYLFIIYLFIPLVGNCSTGDVRLFNGSDKYEGTVQICIGGVWGTVCDRFWSESDGRVVCRQLGYSTAGKEEWRLLLAMEMHSRL